MGKSQPFNLPAAPFMSGATRKWAGVVVKYVCMSLAHSFLLYLMRVGA